MTNKENVNSNNKETLAYVKRISKFYWIQERMFLSPAEAANNLMMSVKELNQLRKDGLIEDYTGITYKVGGEKGCLNLLDESQILKPSKNRYPHIHKDIETLLLNVCGGDRNNFNYLNMAILYKYSNTNDHNVPAIILWGVGGSGKGTLISLLGTIFGENNVLANLGERELNSQFDTFKGQHIIVEYAEVSASNTNMDKRTLNKLKNMVCSPSIIVNEKGVKTYKANSIAWYFISSNSNKPLQLDDKDKGNRRFSVLKSIKKLENGEQINKTIRNKEIVADYLAWLPKAYPEVLNFKKLEALENEDKRELEERSQEDANKFWDWLYDNYPKFRGKKTKHEVHEMITVFCLENDMNEKEFLKFFWHNSRYPLKRLRMGDKLPYGVELSE